MSAVTARTVKTRNRQRHKKKSMAERADRRELLDEAGFSRVTVYREETDPESGEGTSVYSPATVGDADPGWICFLVAEK